jgi:hypothetical protein
LHILGLKHAYLMGETKEVKYANTSDSDTLVQNWGDREVLV